MLQRLEREVTNMKLIKAGLSRLELQAANKQTDLKQKTLTSRYIISSDIFVVVLEKNGEDQLDRSCEK
jgi:hypothetical protein